VALPDNRSVPLNGAQELFEKVPGDRHAILAVGADVVDRRDVRGEGFARSGTGATLP
jgi:hypothetical protein